jgi:diacylglycerol kinase
MAGKGRVLSFKYAFEGLWTALKDEPNLKIHIFLAVLVLLLGIFFQITLTDWLLVFFAIGLVISVELTNTAIEEVVNSFTSNTHPSAKKAKDVAAGAVLISACTALIIGLFVFLPYIADFITGLR